KEKHAATRAAQDLVQARAGLEVLDRTIAALEKQERDAKRAVTAAQAQEERDQADAIRQQLAAHTTQLDAALAVLRELEGCEYIPAPPPTQRELLSFGPRAHFVPKSE
ncbi:hypothetical protein RZS08_65910, partial [Arthrospira platensis SPKY1]|nr:hypothetical protein [Arthrospira platensis SPKY1]